MPSASLKLPEPITSEDTSAFPLWAYITILEKAGDSAFNNYLSGARLLLRWFIVGNQAGLSYPQTPDIKIPRLASGYHSLELAKILTGPRRAYSSWEEYIAVLNNTRLAIYYCTLTTRIPSAPRIS